METDKSKNQPKQVMDIVSKPALSVPPKESKTENKDDKKPSEKPKQNKKDRSDSAWPVVVVAILVASCIIALAVYSQMLKP